jgi:hypothetical protein
MKSSVIAPHASVSTHFFRHDQICQKPAIERPRSGGTDVAGATIKAGPSGAAELLLPATFVISPTGKIRLAYIDEDYAKRLSPDDILAASRSSAAA